MAIELPVLEASSAIASKRVALVGNPNAGKTTLFNALTGLRSQTANYPGITVDVRKAHLRIGDFEVELVDLPGLYSLDALSPEEQVTRNALLGDSGSSAGGSAVPVDLILLTLDSTHLERNLSLAAEVLALNRPTVVALTLSDAAVADGIDANAEKLSKELGCPVVSVSSMTREGFSELDRLVRTELSRTEPREHVACELGCSGCDHADRFNWAEGVVERSVEVGGPRNPSVSSLDRLVTHPVAGVLSFLAVMLGVFYTIFALADVPMSLVDGLFASLSDAVASFVPGEGERSVVGRIGGLLSAACVGYLLVWFGKSKLTWVKHAVIAAVSFCVAALSQSDYQSLLTDGLIGGVGGVVIFLPQICILFFFIALLEDSGYMARAAFVMERMMRAVGLPGKAFVPMLSAHACAIPGIMAARVIEDWRDRLATILVLPLLTCSARLPVYAMVTALLFADRPWMAAATFTGAYFLGIVAALGSAWLLKRTILPGKPVALVLELPPYRRPSLRNALLTVFDRGRVFLRNAGTTILLISIGLWFAASFPKSGFDDYSTAAKGRITELSVASESGSPEADEAVAQIDQIIAQQALANSFAGRLGRAIEPVFAPLGFDWKIDIGILTSFAAREVIVSTLAVVYGVGEDAAEDGGTFVALLDRQTREDGSKVYDTPTCLSLLVFYVLAMQCLPTQVVTKRETGQWRWAILQLVYMTALAYAAALVTFQVAATIVN